MHQMTWLKTGKKSCQKLPKDLRTPFSRPMCDARVLRCDMHDDVRLLRVHVCFVRCAHMLFPARSRSMRCRAWRVVGKRHRCTSASRQRDKKRLCTRGDCKSLATHKPQSRHCSRQQSSKICADDESHMRDPARARAAQNVQRTL